MSLAKADDLQASQTTPAAISSDDPWEAWNRKVYGFNKVVDKWTLRPLSRFYLWVMPSWGEAAVDRFFANLEEPKFMINHALQGSLKGSASSLGRFGLNTLLGFGGIFDVATGVGLEVRPEDFGQSMAAWGWQSSRYLVVPFFGPSTLRDGFGTVVDRPLDPVYYLEDSGARNALTLLDLTATRADLLALEGLLQGDEYSFVRDAYLQNREYAIGNGEVEDDFLDDDF